MAFPTLVPSNRAFDAGNWPIKTFKAQNGAEVRILYGNRRTNMTLSLQYQNISDANTELFLDHFNEMFGTYSTFVLGDSISGVRTGWAGNRDALGAGAQGNYWRYAEPPSVDSVKPGISNVSIKLIGVI
jgi:hypothetical protein